MKKPRPKIYELPDCLRKMFAGTPDSCVAAYIEWRQSLIDQGKELQPLQSIWSPPVFIAGFQANDPMSDPMF
jgi:hypothetical protein